MQIGLFNRRLRIGLVDGEMHHQPGQYGKGHDIAVDTSSSGEPQLRLSPAASAIAAARHLGPLRCSATHEAGLALAVVAAGHAFNKEDL